MALQEFSAPQETAPPESVAGATAQTGPQETGLQEELASQEYTVKNGGILLAEQPTAEQAVVIQMREPALGGWDWQDPDATDRRRQFWRATITILVMALIALAMLVGGLWLMGEELHIF